MNTSGKPIQLDKDIAFEEPEKRSGKKQLKVPWPYVAGGIGVLLIAMLLFINPQKGEFIESPPPEEQAERDSIYSVAVRIQQYQEDCDSLPVPADLSLPVNFTYEKEDEMLWSLETETGLYYSSDMNLESFRMGEI
ncbi:MAG: hypothetical protein K8S62_14155 [Candidatus Sabulitectum sp.]|nr:hypothetical protein [Candidatus Sabulitectum sp.]